MGLRSGGEDVSVIPVCGAASFNNTRSLAHTPPNWLLPSWLVRSSDNINHPFLMQSTDGAGYGAHHPVAGKRAARV